MQSGVFTVVPVFKFRWKTENKSGILIFCKMNFCWNYCECIRYHTCKKGFCSQWISSINVYCVLLRFVFSFKSTYVNVSMTLINLFFFSDVPTRNLWRIILSSLFDAYELWFPFSVLKLNNSYDSPIWSGFPRLKKHFFYENLILLSKTLKQTSSITIQIRRTNRFKVFFRFQLVKP